MRFRVVHFYKELYVLEYKPEGWFKMWCQLTRALIFDDVNLSNLYHPVVDKDFAELVKLAKSLDSKKVKAWLAAEKAKFNQHVNCQYAAKDAIKAQSFYCETPS